MRTDETQIEILEKKIKTFLLAQDTEEKIVDSSRHLFSKAKNPQTAY